LQEAKTRIDKLSARGVRVLLFDTPSDPSVDYAIGDELIAVQKAFPEPKYEWVHMQPQHWQMMDMTHISGPAAKQFAASLEQQLPATQISSTNHSI